MSRKNIRREPVFSESDQAGERTPREFSDSHPPPPDGLDPRLRLAAFAVVFICSVFFIEWGIQKYYEYRANQALKEMVAGWEESIEASAAQLQAASERNRKEAERKRLAIREQRASTNQGKWLAKICSDWRRTYDDLKAATAKREMQRHCRLYESYLKTGIADTPVN